MEKCTAKQIEEKRKQALEKLKARKSQLTVNNNVPEQKKAADQIEANRKQALEKLKARKSQLAVNNHENVNVPVPRKPEQLISVNFEIASETRFEVNFQGFSESLVSYFRQIPSKQFDYTKKMWNFALEDYEKIINHIRTQKVNAKIGSQIPQFVLKILNTPIVPAPFSALDSIEPTLLDSLSMFQREAVLFGISRNGKVLLGDDMGLGKTRQALAIADYYRSDWPLLIVSNKSTREFWATEIRQLLPSISCHYIQIIENTNEVIGDAKIVITSYSLLDKNIDKLLTKGFRAIIFDESHYIKNSKAKCAQSADQLGKKAVRIILCSGTPALSRPVELYQQLKLLDKGFCSYKEYTIRYCEGKQNAFGWTANGAQNLRELGVILNKKFMIRRLKNETQESIQLLPKKKHVVPLKINRSTFSQHQENIDEMKQTYSQARGLEKESVLLQFFTITAQMKLESVTEFIREFVKNEEKFLIFAHHHIMLDGISECLNELNVNYIRIDGSTSGDVRNDRVRIFQTTPDCLAAVLSLKACNAGITLTKAKNVIFAELYWDPSTMEQAECRAHRIGQQAEVNVFYLVGTGTADDIIWNMLEKKQKTLKTVGLLSGEKCDDEVTKIPAKNKKQEESENLFGDSSNDDELFLQIKTQTFQSEAGTSNAKPDPTLESLFNDEDDDLLMNLEF